MDSMHVILHLLDEAYERKAWHGPNLRGSLRGLTAARALRRPKPGRHSIWELVLHAAYWKYAVRRRILGEKRGSFPIRGSNWFSVKGKPSEKSWRADLKLLDQSHRALRKTVAGMSARELAVIPQGSKVDNFRTIIGIAAHDLYHAGQIQLLKRLYR